MKQLVLIGLGLAVVVYFVFFRSPALASPAVGDPAPDFKLMDQNGDWHSLSDYEGQWIALYFYPKDDTPGCTKEACAFRDNIFAFRDIGVEILGVSLDAVESHQEFAEKYQLPFSLLADTDAAVATDYGVLTKRGPVQYASRQSYLIDPQGRIAKHYPKVDPETHSAEVLKDLQSLMADSDQPSG